MQPATESAYPLAADLPYDSFEQPDDGVQWGRYVAALKRYKWLILLVTLVGTGLGVVATRFVKPEYTVQATIFIENPPDKEGPVRPNPVLESYAWQELLQTNVIMNTVVRKEGLLFQPADPSDSLAFRGFALASRFQPGSYTLTTDAAGRRYTLSTGEGVTVEQGVVGDSIGIALGMQWAPPATVLGQERELSFTLLSPTEASGAIKENLVPLMAEDGNFLRLLLTGSDPARITRILNAVTDEFVTVAARLKKEKLTEEAQILSAQLDSTERNLREAESRLENFKVRTITRPGESTPIAPGLESTSPTVISDYFQKKVQLDAIQQDRRAIERVLGRTRSGEIAIDQFLQIPSVKAAPDLNSVLTQLATKEAELRALRTRYTDEAPQVKDVLAEIQTLRTQTIPSYATALMNGLRAQEQGLTGDIASSGRELQSMPTRSIEEQRLMREVEQAAALYADVASRHHSARLAEASAIPDVKVLDPASRPEKPTTNTAPRIIFMALMASIGAAIGLAILLDQLDKRFRYPDQVTRELGLSILGAIPAIRKVRPGERDADEASQVIEAFRTVRMNLAHSYGAAGPVMLTVTSPGPGDGKSLVSSNLALSFAEAGYRTLLIDGDIRRGELHRMFNTDRRPGLLDYLVGQVGIEAVLRPTTHKNLTVVPCGTRHQHGPELLGSNAMRELLADLKTRYNVVIIDSPPLGAGIDPFVLSTATGNMMLVLRSGETDRMMAEAKLKLVERLPVRVLGAVLNDIQTTGVYKYYSYVYGYTADDEPAQLASGGGDAGR